MPQELIYTSYTKGVKPGVSGFCTVVVSEDMAPNRISRLESLSGYRHLYQPGTPDAALNPPAWSHVLMNIGDSEFHVVYRVGDAGLDYTGRSNKLGHFIVLEKNELPPCGPATMLLTPGLIETQFDGNVGTRPFSRPIPHQLVSPRPCNLWKQIAGDAGWAGLLAQTAYTGQHACILFKPGTDMLPLIQEAMALLPPEMRWKTTFSTYFSKLPTGLDCQWRCAVTGTPEAALAMAEREKMFVIDLSRGPLEMAPNSPAVMAARTGRGVVAPKGEIQNRTYANVNKSRPKQTHSNVSNEEILLDLEQENTQTSDPFDSLETYSPMVVKTSKPKKKVAKEITLLTWIIAGVCVSILLIGIMIGVVCCVSKPSQNIATLDISPIVTENQTKDNQSSRTDKDKESTESTADDEKSVEEQQQEKEALREAEEKARQEAARKAEEEKRIAEQKQKEEQEAQRKAEEEKRIAEQKQKEEQEAQRKAAEEKARQEEAARKAKDEQERKAAFDDPRWVGIPEEDWFIFVNADNTLDYTRLNYQIKKHINEIVNIEAIHLEEQAPNMGFSIEKSENENKYVVLEDKVQSEVTIELTNKQDATGGFSEQPCFYIDGSGNAAFDEFVKNCVLKVSFSDKKTKIISFVKVENNNQLLIPLEGAIKKPNGIHSLKNMTFEKYKYNKDKFGLNWKIYIDSQIAKPSWEFGNILSVKPTNNGNETDKNNGIEIAIEVNKSIELKPIKQKVQSTSIMDDENKPDNREKIRKKIDVEQLIVYITPVNGTVFPAKKEMVTQNKDGVNTQNKDGVNTQNKDEKSITIKYKFLLKGNPIPIGEQTAFNLFDDKGFTSFVQKNIGQLPIYVDISLESLELGTSDSFMWKRLTIQDIQCSPK